MTVVKQYFINLIWLLFNLIRTTSLSIQLIRVDSPLKFRSRFVEIAANYVPVLNAN